MTQISQINADFFISMSEECCLLTIDLDNMKNSILLMITLVMLPCTDNRNPPLVKVKLSVMSSSDLENYMSLTNSLDKEDDYFELMPYALKMQKQGLGYYVFFKTYMRIVFEDKFDSKI